jgi:hypothetical protein
MREIPRPEKIVFRKIVPQRNGRAACRARSLFNIDYHGVHTPSSGFLTSPFDSANP